MSVTITFYEALRERPWAETGLEQGKSINKRSPASPGSLPRPLCELGEAWRGHHEPECDMNLSRCRYAKQNKRDLWLLSGRADGSGYWILPWSVGEEEYSSLPGVSACFLALLQVVSRSFGKFSETRTLCGQVMGTEGAPGGLADNKPRGAVSPGEDVG